MKKYIRSNKSMIDTSMFSGTPFIPDTGMSLYNQYLDEDDLKYRQDRYNRTGKIVMMTPNEYFYACSRYGFDHWVSFYDLMDGRRENKESLDKINKFLDSGAKLWVPYINIADHSQEGLHRMMVVGDKYGWDKKFPVLVVSVFDKDIEAQNILRREAHEFRDNDFKTYCDWTVNNQTYEKSTPLDIQALESEICKTCKLFKDVDVEIDVEISDVDEGKEIKIWLLSYGEYEFKSASNPYTTIIHMTTELPPIDDDDLFI